MEKACNILLRALIMTGEYVCVSVMIMKMRIISFMGYVLLLYVCVCTCVLGGGISNMYEDMYTNTK